MSESLLRVDDVVVEFPGKGWRAAQLTASTGHISPMLLRRAYPATDGSAIKMESKSATPMA